MTTNPATTNNPTKTKLNRWQKLLTAEQARQLPALYSQDGKGLNAIAHVKYFCGGFTWFMTEFDPTAEFDPESGIGPQPGQFFGLCISPTCPDGELGYVAAAELCSRQTPSMSRISGNSFRMAPVVERDLHFTPKPLLAAFKEFTRRDHPGAKEAAGAVCLNGTGCDCTATAIVDGVPVCDRHNPSEF
jgi:hypothetical protein